MKHIRGADKFAKCGAFVGNAKDEIVGEAIVDAAMESDCSECRAAVMVQPVEWSKKDANGVSHPINVRPGVGDYAPEPRPDAETMLRDLANKRNGY